MAYIIDFYTQYSTKVQNTNFSDPVASAALRADTGPSNVCIVHDV